MGWQRWSDPNSGIRRRQETDPEKRSVPFTSRLTEILNFLFSVPTPEGKTTDMFKKKRYIIAGIMILFVLGYLGFTAFQHAATYYYTVDEVVAKNTELIDRNIKLGGVVVLGSVQQESNAGTIRFTIAGEGQTMPVIYDGVVPDSFTENNDVVVEGTFDSTGTFNAHTIIVKCQSRYVSGDQE